MTAKKPPARKAVENVTAPTETPPAETNETAPAAVTGAAECAVPGCRRTPTTHAVCDGHWATHRGLATKEQ